MSAQLTFQQDEFSEEDVEELKRFFGTKSSAAAVRRALALARVIAPLIKDRTLLVKDQNAGNQEIRVVLTG